jgi:hypothetical protein
MLAQNSKSNKGRSNRSEMPPVQQKEDNTVGHAHVFWSVHSHDINNVSTGKRWYQISSCTEYEHLKPHGANVVRNGAIEDALLEG